MKEATIIFPHQLFKEHPALQKDRPVYLVEETLFFNQYKFHQQKILLHRASMKGYAAHLTQKKYTVSYVDATTPHSDSRKLIEHLHGQGITALHIAAVADNWLQQRVTAECKKYSICLTMYNSPAFLNTMEGVKNFFDGKKNYFQTTFYTEQRKQRKILLDASGGPAGGKWSYDADNRMRFPAKEKVPVMVTAKQPAFVKEAHEYVADNFAGHYGNTRNFIYPVDFAGAEKWLDDFLQTRFSKFGIYEDAIVAKEHYLHHSVISPLLNIGLLTPQQVIDKAIAAAGKYAIPLNSLEGFIRQVMGWREFIRIVYEREGSRQRTKNYWGFTRKIPASFWQGTTGIAPVDNVIQKVLNTGYSHHIERLMVMGNFMVLCEFDPDEVYKWFIEMYIDAYDWVMVPNTYGMTQFADGGLMMTKPYISSSNYLLKMSDYKTAFTTQEKGWEAIWDGLFWRFMHVHRSFFLKNPRLGLLLKTFDKMPAEKRNKHLDIAEKFLVKLDKGESEKPPQLKLFGTA